jgi:hypothetical protein
MCQIGDQTSRLGDQLLHDFRQDSVPVNIDGDLV